MKDNQSIIEVLREAVTKDPENPALRLHLASLYLKDLNGAEALDQAARVLAHEPDNIDAVELAAQAAEMAGQSERARGYQRLLGALRPEPATGGNAQGDFAFAEKVLERPAEEMTDAVLDETD